MKWREQKKDVVKFLRCCETPVPECEPFSESGPLRLPFCFNCCRFFSLEVTSLRAVQYVQMNRMVK